MISYGINEFIVEDAALTWFGGLCYAVGHWSHLAHGEAIQARDNVFGLPPRISTPSSPNLDLSSPNMRSSSSCLVASSSVLPASSYALKEAIP